MLAELQESSEKDRALLAKMTEESEALRAQIQAFDAEATAARSAQEELAGIKKQLLSQREETRALQLAFSEKEKGWNEARQNLQDAQGRYRSELDEAHATHRRLLKTLLRIEPIAYGLNSSEIESEQTRVLAQVRQVLAIYPEAAIEIAGHTCTIGSAADNLALSEARAREPASPRARGLRDYLARNGVDPEQMIARGWGQDQPIASNDTDEGRRQNRRVEVIVHPLGLGAEEEAASAP